MRTNFLYLSVLIIFPLIWQSSQLPVFDTKFPASAPVNDNFSNAMLLRGPSGTLTSYNNNATNEYGERQHAKQVGGVSIWYKWVAPTGSLLEFNTVGSNFDTLLAVYTSSDGKKPTLEIVSNDDARSYPGTVSQVKFVALKGLKYFIAVDGYRGVTGRVVLNWKSWDLIAEVPGPRPINVPGQLDTGGNLYFPPLFGHLSPGWKSSTGGSVERPAQLDVTLKGFDNGWIDMRLIGPGNRVYPLPPLQMLPSQADVSWKYVVPVEYPIGEYSVYATNGDLVETFTFSLTEATVPNLVVDPEIQVGESFNLYFAGFPSNTRIPLYLYNRISCPPGSPAGKVCYQYLTGYKAWTNPKGQGTYRLGLNLDFGPNSYVLFAEHPDQDIYATFSVGSNPSN